MAFFAKKKKARVIKKIVHYFLFLNIVTQFVTCFGSLGLRDEGFLAKNENDMYGFDVKNTLQDSLNQKNEINSGVAFSPAFLDFGDRPIGMPCVEQVRVENRDTHLPLHLLSISGSSSHYHCSFFEDKLVPPLGNTTFEVCFLARHLGTINTILYIHSSRGSFKYHMFGAGAPNPYRIKPMLGARVPLNGSFSPLIQLHNPHSSVLQVHEVYSSGSDLHLELPSGQTEASKELWELRPYETKPIMRATFIGRVQDNHTAFIRIKTDKETPLEMLILPFQVEVVSEPDIFSGTDTLDFGLLQNSEDEVSLPVKLFNSASKSIHIYNMTVEPPTAAISIQFKPVRLKANLLTPSQTATISFHASRARSEWDCKGHIVVWSTAHNNKLYIPFQAQVLFGSLWYDQSKMWFSDIQPYNIADVDDDDDDISDNKIVDAHSDDIKNDYESDENNNQKKDTKNELNYKEHSKNRYKYGNIEKRYNSYTDNIFESDNNAKRHKNMHEDPYTDTDSDTNIDVENIESGMRGSIEEIQKKLGYTNKNNYDDDDDDDGGGGADDDGYEQEEYSELLNTEHDLYNEYNSKNYNNIDNNNNDIKETQRHKRINYYEQSTMRHKAAHDKTPSSKRPHTHSAEAGDNSRGGLKSPAMHAGGEEEEEAAVVERVVRRGGGVVVQRRLRMQNRFKVPLVIFNASLPHDALKFFYIDDFHPPLLWQAGQLTTLFTLNFHSGLLQHPFSSHLTLYTNLSSFTLPIHSYNGKFNVYHNTGGLLREALDFGTLSVAESRSINFTIVNNNPIDIAIYNLESSYDDSKVSVLSTQHNNGSSYQHHSNISQAVIKSQHRAVFQLNLLTPPYEQALNAHVIVQTKYQILRIPFKLRTVIGSLLMQPPTLSFHHCFPGKVTRVELQVNSTFQESLKVTTTAFLNLDPRFSIKTPKDRPFLLTPFKLSPIGRLSIDPGKTCGDECYTGLQTNTPGGSSWLKTLRLGREVFETDSYLLNKASQLWNKILLTGAHILNATMQLDTDHVQGFLFPITAHLFKPTLLHQSLISFPYTHIGNHSLRELTIENPSDQPLIVQLVFSHAYPDFPHLFDSLNAMQTYGNYVDNDPQGTFSVSNISLYHNSSTPILPRETILSTSIHPNTTTIILSPQHKLLVHVIFKPLNTDLKHSYLVVRNNLTIVEVVKLQGQGSWTDIRFSGRRSGSPKPLIFEMTDKQLKSCEKGPQTNPVLLSDFVLKRTFTMLNAGNLPVYILSFSISGSPCEGHGFKVIECYPTILSANSSRKINVIFSPDFVMSRTRQLLEMQTDVGVDMKFLLQATIPAHMVRACYQSLPRPRWEATLYYSVIFSMLVMFFSVTITSHFEANRLIMDRFNIHNLELFFNGYEKSKILDLKNLRPATTSTLSKAFNRKLSVDSTDHHSKESSSHSTSSQHSSNYQPLTHTPSNHSTSNLSSHQTSMHQQPSTPAYSEPFSLTNKRSILFCLFNKLLNRHKRADKSSHSTYSSERPASLTPSNNKLSKKDHSDDHHADTAPTTSNGHACRDASDRRSEGESTLTLRKLDRSSRKSKHNCHNVVVSSSPKATEHTHNEDLGEVSQQHESKHHAKSEAPSSPVAAKSARHKEAKKEQCHDKGSSTTEDTRASPEQSTDSSKGKKLKSRPAKQASATNSSSSTSNSIVGIATTISTTASRKLQAVTSTVSVTHSNHTQLVNTTTTIITTTTASIAATIIATTATIAAMATTTTTTTTTAAQQTSEKPRHKKTYESSASISPSNSELSCVKSDLPHLARKKSNPIVCKERKKSSSANSMNEIVAQTKAFARSIQLPQCSTQHKDLSHFKPHPTPHNHLVRTTTDYLVTRSSTLASSISCRISRGVEAVVTSVLRTSEWSSMDTATSSMPATKSISTTRPIAAVGATVRRSWNPQPTTTSFTSTPFQGPLINGFASDSCQPSLPIGFPSPPVTSSFASNNYYTDAQTFVFNNQENTRNFLNTEGMVEPFVRPASPEKQLTLMQKLMAERRKRQFEYQKRLMLNPYQDDWPGFDNGQSALPASSSLLPNQTWNSNACQRSTWMPTNGDVFYDMPTNNNPTPSYEPISPPLSGLLSSIWENAEGSSRTSVEDPSYSVFDPFNTLENRGNIWNPTSTVTGMNNGWAGCPLTKSKKE